VGIFPLPGSFACRRAGLNGSRSGTFWSFWSLMRGLIAKGRRPRIIALENVCGTLTSHNGQDFVAICGAFEEAGFVVGVVVIDATLFVPQSRKRLFIIGVRGDLAIPAELTQSEASPIWHTSGLRKALDKAPAKVRKNWIWWSLPEPPLRNTPLRV
jgi:DNA (cytosine-5)-methyltransferase 1